jgi:regulator of RNase E activity RraA
MTDRDPAGASAPEHLALLDRFRSYSVALIADALDQLARHDQVMAPRLSQLSGSGTMAGYAVTVAVGASHRGVANPYAKEFEAIELLREGSILVAATDGPPAAFWGELLTSRARRLGARGAVIDGYARDLARIRADGFPLWAKGTNACDSAGRLEAYAVGGTVMCAGVAVRMGDLIVGDCDGIVVVPQELVAETLRRVVGKDEKEAAVREALARGATTHQVYEEYGVL